MTTFRTFARMRRRRDQVRALLLGTLVAVANLGGAPAVSAHTLVDPAGLTPPLQPYRVCYQDGVWIKCDTSNTDTWRDVPVLDLPCGTVYETATQVRRAVRWYNSDKLLVERNAEEEINGTWTLSATGAGPSVRFRVNDGWHEHFVIPGDLSSDVERAHGSFLHVIGFGNVLLDVGVRLSPDETQHGYSFFDPASNIFDGTDPVRAAILCAALSA